jgi:hypothetical protein
VAGDESRLLNLGQQCLQRNSKVGRVDTAGMAVDIADSAADGVDRKGHIVEHTAGTAFHPHMEHRGHIPAPVPHECLRRADSEV